MLDSAMAGDAEEINQKIRQAMAYAMNEQKITAADLATRLGKTRSYGYQLTSGDRAKIPDSLMAALNALDLELVVQARTDAAGNKNA